MSIIDPNHPIRQDLSQVQRGHELPWFPLAWKVIDGLEESRDYGFAELAKIAGVKTDSADMVSALTFLSTCPSAIFDAHLCLYENGRRIPLDDNDIPKILNNEPIWHPETGEAIIDPSKQAFMFYRMRSGL
mgnify:FL=1